MRGHLVRTQRSTGFSLPSNSLPWQAGNPGLTMLLRFERESRGPVRRESS